MKKFVGAFLFVMNISALVTIGLYRGGIVSIEDMISFSLMVIIVTTTLTFLEVSK